MFLTSELTSNEDVRQSPSFRMIKYQVCLRTPKSFMYNPEGSSPCGVCHWVCYRLVFYTQYRPITNSLKIIHISYGFCVLCRLHSLVPEGFLVLWCEAHRRRFESVNPRPLKWRQSFPSKSRVLSTKWHGVISQRKGFFKLLLVRDHKRCCQ